MGKSSAKSIHLQLNLKRIKSSQQRGGCKIRVSGSVNSKNTTAKRFRPSNFCLCDKSCHMCEVNKGEIKVLVNLLLSAHVLKNREPVIQYKKEMVHIRGGGSKTDFEPMAWEKIQYI